MSVNFKEIAKNAVVNEGNTSRLIKVFEKARRGEALTVGLIGGSVSEGALSSEKKYRFIEVVGEWFKKYFNNNNITVINAGKGATNSMYGLFRADRDLLCKAPDFVVVDYACNDFLEDEYAKNEYEMLIRHILEQKNAPAVMIFTIMRHDGGNVEELHHPAGFFYNLPIVSVKAAIYPEIQKGNLTWKELSNDEVHPTDFGHGVYALLITEYLERADKGEIGDRAEYKIPDGSLNGFMHSNPKLLSADDITPTDFGGFAVGDTPYGVRGFVAKEKNKPIVFNIKCSNIGISYLRWNTYTFGKGELTIDDTEKFILDGHFPVTWGGFLCSKMLKVKLENKVHKISIRLIDEKPEGVMPSTSNLPDTIADQTKRESTGEDFMFCYLLISD